MSQNGQTTREEAVAGEERFPRLIYLGSPENGFISGGESFALDGVRAIRFGRSLDGREISSERHDGTLHMAAGLPWVSGVHAEISITDGGDGLLFNLTDLRSRNGTLVEGAPVIGATALRLGDVFEVGRSFWMLREGARMEPDRGESPLAVPTANPGLRSLCTALARLARSNVPIVVSGETGTGKRFVAAAIHAASAQKGELVTINLSAAPIEDLLFGDPPLFERAPGGTLLLTELGELSFEDQTKLVSAMMARGSRASGDGRSRPRLIASSTRDLRGMVHSGEFRPDLYGRLGGFEARLPSLRHRREDIGLLVRQRLAAAPQKLRIATEVFRRMLAHRWPFNFRELQQRLDAAIAMADPAGIITVASWESLAWSGDEVAPARIQAVRQELVHQLLSHGGDTRAVARSLGIELAQVTRWLERLELSPEQYARG